MADWFDQNSPDWFANNAPASSQSEPGKVEQYFRSLPNPLTFHPNYGPDVSDVDTGPSYDLMKFAAPGTAAFEGVKRLIASGAGAGLAGRALTHVVARKLGIPVAVVDAALEHLRMAKPPLPGQTGGAPYFGERGTYGTTAGPTGPAPSGPVPTGTVNLPAPQPQSMPGTLAPAARGPITGTGQTYPPGYGFPQPEGIAAPEAAAAPGRDTTMLEGLSQQYQGKPYAKLKGAEKNAIDALHDKITRKAIPSSPPPEDPFVRDEHGNALMRKGTEDPADVSAGGIPAPKPVHEAAHAIDTHFSPRKAMNLTRHLTTEKTPMSYEEVQAMVNQAKQTGDWSKINDIEQKAWESGKALEASGAAKPGSLVPKTKYRPKTADYSDIKGIENTEGTWDRVLQTYPRRPTITPQLTAPQPMGFLPPPAWPPQPPVPSTP